MIVINLNLIVVIRDGAVTFLDRVESIWFSTSIENCMSVEHTFFGKIYGIEFKQVAI